MMNPAQINDRAAGAIRRCFEEKGVDNSADATALLLRKIEKIMQRRSRLVHALCSFEIVTDEIAMARDIEQIDLAARGRRPVSLTAEVLKATY